MGHSARVETDMDKITIERETLERAIADYDSAAGNDGTLLSWNRARDNLLALLRAALAAHPAEAQQEPVRDIIEGWKSATFGWNGTNPISYEKARADHAEECIRRIEAALTAQPAPAAVPPGYALVPIEPTPEMCKIGGHVMSEWTDDSAPLRERTYAVAFADAYRAMIAAAGKATP